MSSRSKTRARRAAETLAWRQAAESVLLPLMRALLARGLRYRDIVEIVDRATLAAAGGQRAGSDLDAARRAGLPLEKQRRLRARQRGAVPMALPYAAGTRLISRWSLDPEYTDGGAPRPLPLAGPKSFATLAQKVDSDPTVALHELKRLGLVRVGKGTARLIADAYVPGVGMIEKLDILGRHGAEFLRTMIHNVSAAPAEAVLQRCVSYDNIGSAALKPLRARLRPRALDALAAVNRELAVADRDRNPSAPGGRRTRVSFGIYIVEEPVTRSRPKRRQSTSGRRQAS